jgi:hypothetical protein
MANVAPRSAPLPRRSSPELAVAREWVIPFEVPPDRVALVSRVRSTLVASSIEAVRERGLFDRYAALLPQAYRAMVLESIAGTWLPLEAGVAHYRAIDGLALGASEVLDAGRSVAEKVQGTVFATLARLATGAGVTPWTAMSQLHRLWGRLFVGGAVAVSKHGPKEAHIDVAGNPLVDIPYFRGAFRGLVAEGLRPFCTHGYVTEVARGHEPARLVLKVAWV